MPNLNRRGLAAIRLGYIEYPRMTVTSDVLFQKYPTQVFGPQWSDDNTVIFSANEGGDLLWQIDLRTGQVVNVFPGVVDPVFGWKVSFNIRYAGAGVIAGYGGPTQYWDNTTFTGRRGTPRIPYAVDDLTGAIFVKAANDDPRYGVWNGNEFRELINGGDSPVQASWKNGVLVFCVGSQFYKWQAGQGGPTLFQTVPQSFGQCHWSGGWNVAFWEAKIVAWPDGRFDQWIDVTAGFDPWHLYNIACQRVGDYLIVASAYGQGEIAGELQQVALNLNTKQVSLITDDIAAYCASYALPAASANVISQGGGQGAQPATLALATGSADLPVPILALVGGVLLYMYWRGDVV